MAKMKKGTKILIVVVVVVAVIGIALTALVMAGKKAVEQMVSGNISMTELERTDLTNTISVTGNIQSASVKKVYLEASGAGKATQVNVKVGDQVNQGDVLCAFDTSDLERDYEKSQVSANQSAERADITLADAKTSYSNGKISQDQLVKNAENNVELMQDRLEQAQEDYEDALEKYNKGELELTLSVDSAYTQAQYAYTSAKSNSNDLYLAWKQQESEYNHASGDDKAALEAAMNAAQIAYQQAQTQTDNAKAAYDAAKKEYEAKDTNVESLLDDYREAVEDAKENLADAEKSLNDVKKQRELALSSYSHNIESARIGTDQTVTQMGLEDALDNIEKCTITAPVSGTVTAVYVTEGESNSMGSMLFIIEDLSHLEIETTVKEYDISSLKVGMPVEVKTDATGDTVYTGTVKEIAVTAQKDSQGNTLSAATAEFAVTLSVDPGEGGLMAGMNGRATIAVESKQDVLAIMYSAVAYDQEGKPYVMVARSGEEGGMTVSKIYVDTGLETDFEVELISNELKEGDLIIDNPEAVSETMEIMSAGR